MSPSRPFKNRRHAGKQLALALIAYAGCPAALVLALPRGGVTVGYYVATALGLALDVLIVKKLGLPGFEEFAIGAVGSDGIRVVNPAAVAAYHISAAQVDAACIDAMQEIALRERKYRHARAPPQLHGLTVILVDDGIATGSTMQAAIRTARSQHAGKIVVAAPVGASDTCSKLALEADDLVCLNRPRSFGAVSESYQRFDQVSDDEVQDLLSRVWHDSKSTGPHF